MKKLLLLAGSALALLLATSQARAQVVTITVGTVTFPLADLPAGTYLLHLTQSAAHRTQRLIKQ